MRVTAGEERADVGSMLVVMVVPEELLREPTRPRIRKKRASSTLISIETPGEKSREFSAEFFVEAAERGDVWCPPPEPWREQGPYWYKQRGAYALHTKAIRRSLEKFINGKMKQLDGMGRTGHWVLERARLPVSSVRAVPAIE